MEPVVSARDFRRFINYPYVRHRADPHWIPPLRIAERDRLRPRKNPFFAHADHALLLARRNGIVCGRVAAFDDRLHNQTHGDNIASFGFFDADDGAAAAALLAAVEAWAAARGRAAVRGPLNPSLNEEAGLLIDGFDTDPMLLMPHNPPEYAAFIEAAGYAKAKDLVRWMYNVAGGPGRAVEKVAARFKARERIEILPLDAREFDRQVDRLRLLYCGAWERNWGFVPPTPAEFRRIAADLKLILDPRLAIRAEVDGTMIGCAIALPDINQALKGTNGRLFPIGIVRLLMRRRIIDQTRALLLGLLPKYRHTACTRSCGTSCTGAPRRPATAARSCRGCWRTTTTSTTPSPTPARGATRRTESIRRRSRETHCRDHRRYRLHRTESIRAPRGARRSRQSDRAARVAARAAAADRGGARAAHCRRARLRNRRAPTRSSTSPVS